MPGRVLRVLVPLPRVQARHLPRQEQGDHSQGQEVQGLHLLRLTGFFPIRGGAMRARAGELRYERANAPAVFVNEDCCGCV